MSSGLSQITRPVLDELSQVESLLHSEMNSSEPWLASLMDGLQGMGGKRMRPLMLLLFGLASGKVDESHVRASVAFELVHLATLVHDDIIDHAGIRRGRPTLHRRNGVRSAVLAGDWLFAQAYCVASQIGNPKLIGELATSTGRVCSGEIRQNHFAGDMKLSLDDYISIVSGKTASLCASACRSGVLLNSCDEQLAGAAWQFGNQVGIAFQIIDDCLDLEGSAEVVGKTLGTDAAGGKLTYPLIHAMSLNNGQNAKRIANCLKGWSASSADDLVSMLEESDSLSAARQFAEHKIGQARQVITHFPSSPARDSLDGLASFVIRREW